MSNLTSLAGGFVFLGIAVGTVVVDTSRLSKPTVVVERALHVEPAPIIPSSWWYWPGS
jgi:hypothetical protein